MIAMGPETAGVDMNRLDSVDEVAGNQHAQVRHANS